MYPGGDDLNTASEASSPGDDPRSVTADQTGDQGKNVCFHIDLE